MESNPSITYTLSFEYEGVKYEFDELIPLSKESIPSNEEEFATAQNAIMEQEMQKFYTDETVSKYEDKEEGTIILFPPFIRQRVILHFSNFKLNP